MVCDPESALARALEFQRGSMALVGTEFTPIPEGRVARTPSLPRVWNFNHVALTVALPPAEARAVVDRHLSDLPHRALIVEHSEGEAMVDDFKAHGWRLDRDVTMVLAGDPDPELDTSAVVEAPEAPALGLMRGWIAEDEALRRDPPALEQVLESSGLVWRARNATRLGVLGRDGTLAGITMLYSDGVVAQVEDVYVAPAERGRGFGRAMVTRAAALAVEAEHEFIFIVADDDGWPKRLYADVGFEPVGRTWIFDHAGD